MAPARAEDLSGLPPAYIAVAGHDPLRDDGMRYAELLRAAGVPVEVHNAKTLVHGYAGYDGVVPAATDAVERALWIDGELTIRKQGVRFRRVPNLKISFFTLETYYHGLPADYDQKNPIRVGFDNLVMARKYIGPMRSERHR